MIRKYVKNKNLIKIFALVSILTLIAFISSNFIINKDKDIAVVKISGTKIYKSEIEQKLEDVFSGYNNKAEIPQIKKLPREVIEILAKEIYTEKELTKKATKSRLANNYETKKLIKEITDKILRQSYIKSIIDEEIGEKEISIKFSELNQELAGQKQYDVYHIVLKTKKEAQKIRNQLNNGNFARLAKKYSIDLESAQKGGNLGYILEKNMIEEIFSEVQKLGRNQISKPIKTKFGWHLVKYSKSKKVEPLEFETVKENIRAQLVQDTINEINEEIIKDKKIKILIDLEKNEKDQEEK